MKSLSKTHKVVIFAVTLCAAIYATLRFTPYLELERFKERDYSTRVYDDKGQLLQILPLNDGLRREWTNLEDIPAEVVKYLLVSEDKRFYFHNGVDYSAILRAFFQNVKSRRTVRGASTITMQLVRIIEPSLPGEKRTVFTKLQEAFDAHRLESRLSKKEILELYLNNVPFGLNCEGVTSAARTIFGKNLHDLTESEICTLAIIPRRPSENNPFANPDLCAQKASELYTLVNKSNIQIDYSGLSRYTYPFEMPHYIQYLTKTLRAQNKTLPPELHLTANLELYNFVRNAALHALELSEDSRISNAAVLVIDNEKNSVLTWLGNANWYDFENSGQVDGVTALNQPGSSMKPFLYALGLETEYKPTSVLADVPKEFGSSNVYIPANFNNRFNGPVRYRVALASSLNIPAVTVLNTVGVDKYLAVLKKLGFNSLENVGESADLGLALGAGEVSLSELVPAFSVFMRDGNYIPLTYFQEDAEIEPLRVYQSDTARIISAFLSDKGARAKGFGYTQTFETEYPSIFKTGTSNQYQNIVALGATKKWTVGVWMGNFSGETVIGKTGSSLPAAIAKQILDYLMSSLPKESNNQFAQPDEYELCPVCALSGMLATPSCTSQVFEYVKNDDLPVPCSWHISNSGEVVYPSEYQQWFRLAQRRGKLDYQDSPLSIITPKNNCVFFFDDLKKDYLAVHVELTGGYSDSLRVEIDGSFYKYTSRPFSVDLPVKRGSHQAEFTCGNETVELNYVVK